MHTWSKILFRYCDGGSWTGANVSETIGSDGRALYFAGHYVLRAGIKAMLNKTGMDDVVALPDGGFFVEYGDYANAMRWVHMQMNSTAGLNSRCVQSNIGEEWKCFFAQHAAPHIQTPVFALQSRFDSFQ